jgi:hypothetical protein
MKCATVLTPPFETTSLRVVPDRHKALSPDSQDLLFTEKQNFKSRILVRLPMKKAAPPTPLFCGCCGNEIKDQPSHFHRFAHYCHPCYRRRSARARFKRRLYRKVFVVLFGLGVFAAVSFFLWAYEIAELLRIDLLF